MFSWQSNCRAFADPYVEHDSLMLILDLILLKRDVYRHLLFNRGTGARRLGDSLSSRMTPKLPNTDSPSTKRHESPKARVLDKERVRSQSSRRFGINESY